MARDHARAEGAALAAPPHREADGPGKVAAVAPAPDRPRSPVLRGGDSGRARLEHPTSGSAPECVRAPASRRAGAGLPAPDDDGIDSNARHATPAEPAR